MSLADKGIERPGAPEEAAPRLLIGSAGSTMFFIDTWREQVVHKEGQQQAIQTRVQWPVRLTKARIANLPHIAGGCSVEITEQTAKRIGIPLSGLVEEITKHAGYGLQFVFLDDNENNSRILDALKGRADIEADVQREAVEEAAMGSDLARDESWEDAHKRLRLPTVKLVQAQRA